MKKFSERIGAVEPLNTVQLEIMSVELTNSLWNVIFKYFNENRNDWYHATRILATRHFKTPVDDVPDYDFSCKTWLKDKYFAMPWHEAYDLVEFVSSMYASGPEKFNAVLEAELSGYRFIDGTLAPVSNPHEVEEIVLAMTKSNQCALEGASTHLSKAIELLSMKPDPDYENSIKESISAVESVARSLGDNKGPGLKDALRALSDKAPIHGALRSGFEKLYGYTSDEGGIRHAILDSAEVGFNEAKYMLVSCSAFVNYLILKADHAGMFKEQQKRPN